MTSSNTAPQVSEESFSIGDSLDLIVDYLRGIWRFRKRMVVVTWLVAAILWLSIFNMPDRYNASTRVFIDTDNVLRPLLEGLSVDSNVVNELNFMTKVLVSRPNLEAVARETDLTLTATTPLQYEYLLQSLEDRIRISSDRQNVFTLQFESDQRKVALDVINALLNGLMEKTIGSRVEDSDEAEAVLRQEIENYEARLVESENRLKEFKRKNIGLMPGDGKDYYTRLQTAQAELSTISQQLRVARSERDTLTAQLAGEEPIFGILGGSSAGDETNLQISQLEQELNSLLLEYTEKHPEVLKVKSRLETVKAAQAINQVGRNAAVNPLDLNPVYQNLKIQLSEVKVDLSRLQETHRYQAGVVKNLENLVSVIPEVETQLNQLNRDYDVVRKRYEEMLQRWERLRTAQRVTTHTNSVQFRVIEPPFAPLEASGPPRALYAVVALAIAFCTGLGTALVTHLAKPIVSSAKFLRHLPIKILGTIGFVVTDEVRVAARREKILFGMAFLLLLVATAAVATLAASGFKLQ